MPKYHQHLYPAVKPGNQQEPLTCPICQFQLVKCDNDGNSYHICPGCYSNPPPEHGGDSSTDFPCSKCTHPTCSMATGTRGGDIEVFPCPFCTDLGNEASALLKRRANGYRLSCSNGGRDRCQFVVWLPKAARDISVEDNSDENANMNSQSICQNCSNQNRTVKKLKFVWRMGSVPPHYDQEMLACVLCDDQLKTDMEIRIPSRNQVQPRRTGSNPRGGRSSNNHASGRGGNATRAGGRGRGSGRGRGASSGIQCFRCGGPHYANACPNNQRR